MATRKILNKPTTIDGQIYVCPYTGKDVVFGSHTFLGAIIPQVNGSYVCDPDAHEARKASVVQFNEMEANCNTCKYLERIPHPKQHPAATHRGRCLNHLYRSVVTFHPDDCMGMSYWQPRSK